LIDLAYDKGDEIITIATPTPSQTSLIQSVNKSFNQFSISLGSELEKLPEVLQTSVEFVNNEVGGTGFASSSVLILLVLILTYIPNLIPLILTGYLGLTIKNIFAVYKLNYSEIINMETRSPISFVAITVTNTEGKTILKSMTNKQGRFSVRLLPGEYDISFNHTNYNPKTVRVNQKEYDFLKLGFEMEQLSETILAEQLQFKVLNINPLVPVFIFGFILTFINALVINKPLAWVIVGVVVIVISVYWRKKIVLLFKK